jgi:hypothetical protein
MDLSTKLGLNKADKRIEPTDFKQRFVYLNK